MQSEDLLQIISTAKNLLSNYVNRSFDPLAYSALVTLINLENILDRGRMLLDPLDKKKLSEINLGMDEVRRGILEFMRKLDKEKVKLTLFSAGESFKINFISNLD